MKIISHRGNLSGPDSQTENSPKQIDKVISLGIEVEIDVWLNNNKLFLGHDEPIHEIDHKWLDERSSNLWIHLKNLNAAEYMVGHNLNYFWHENDKMTLTSQGVPWCYPGIYLKNGITVCLDKQKIFKPVYGICTDYVEDYV